MILTKSFCEVRLLLKALGGIDDTIFKACGFGDLCLTSLSDLSRNRTLGLFIGKDFFDINYKSDSITLEGLDALNLIYHIISDDLLKDLPLLHQLYSFLNTKEKVLPVEFKKIF